MKQQIFTRRVLALVAVAAIFGGSAATATADAHESASDKAISQQEARGLARDYLVSIGYSRPGTSILTASVGRAKLQRGTWVVNVRTGGRLPTAKGVVLIDVMDGAIKQSLN